MSMSGRLGLTYTQTALKMAVLEVNPPPVKLMSFFPAELGRVAVTPEYSTPGNTYLASRNQQPHFQKFLFSF